MHKIIMFHGAECPHCQVMQPVVDKLIEEGMPIEKLEVWHSEENETKMHDYAEIIMEGCGTLGVPCFLDAEGQHAICGEMSYDDLKSWLSS